MRIPTSLYRCMTVISQYFLWKSPRNTGIACGYLPETMKIAAALDRNGENCYNTWCKG